MTDAVSDLNQLAADIAGAGVLAGPRASALVRKTAFDIEATAKTLVPVDTAATKNSIYVGKTGTDQPAGFGDVDVEIGPTTSYAPHLEYGTSRMAPHAFMGPALDRHTPDFLKGAEEIGGNIL